MTGDITGIISRSIELTIVTLFCILGMFVDYPISACLIRVAIGAAAITIHDVAVIANLARVDNTIATTAGVDTYILLCSADLLRQAELVTTNGI